jgi:diguanylate cyclase (GGDEF)-like protein
MIKTINRNSNVFMELKRKIYIAIIPFLIPALTLSWISAPQGNDPTSHVTIALTFFLCVFWVMMYKKMYMIRLEMITLFVLGAVHLIRIFVLMSQLDNTTIINLYLLWAPLNFIFALMVLGEKKATIYSISVFAVSVLISVPHFFHEANESKILTQVLLSHLVYIIVLHFAQRLITAYKESEILKKAAFQDSLTKIGNRRMLENLMEEEIKSSEERNTIFSIIYFDIDKFKKINDLHGHEAGDKVLQEMAAIVQDNLRETDYFGRWGGEEFLIVAANQSTKQAIQLAERLRYIIEQHSFKEIGNVTASFGVASFLEEDEPRTLLRRADVALYEAKQNGRNTVKVHSPILYSGVQVNNI